MQILDQVDNPVVILRHQLISRVGSLQGSPQVYPRHLVRYHPNSQLVNLFDFQPINQLKNLDESLVNNLVDALQNNHLNNRSDFLQSNRQKNLHVNRVSNRFGSLQTSQQESQQNDLHHNQLVTHLSSHSISRKLVPLNIHRCNHHSSLGGGLPHSPLGCRQYILLGIFFAKLKFLMLI